MNIIIIIIIIMEIVHSVVYNFTQWWEWDSKQIANIFISATGGTAMGALQCVRISFKSRGIPVTFVSIAAGIIPRYPRAIFVPVQQQQQQQQMSVLTVNFRLECRGRRQQPAARYVCTFALLVKSLNPDTV